MVERLGAWLFGDDGQQMPRLIAVVTAVLGIVSGYALYILWWQQAEHGESGWRFALAFAAAALMSFVFEVLRGAIEGSTHPWSRSRVVSTIVMLAAFELFIIASHTTVELDVDASVGAAGFIFGPEFSETAGPVMSLVLLGLLWVVVALTITSRLRAFIAGWPYAHSPVEPVGSLPQYLAGMAPDLARGAWAGLKAGVIRGALASIGYVLLVRLFFLARAIHDDYPAWLHSMASGGALHLSGLPFFLLYGPTMLAGWGARYLGAFGLLLGIVALSLIARSMASEENRDAATLWPAATIVILLAAPILASSDARRDLLSLAFLSAVIWGTPAMLLGLLTPLLRRPAHHPPVWGVVACAAALVMVVVTAARIHAGPTTGLERGILFAATGALVVLAFALFRGAWSEEFWLCVALSIGTIVWGTTSLMQKVNLFTMQARAQSLIAVPIGPASPAARPADPLLTFMTGRQLTSVDLLDNGVFLLPRGLSHVDLVVNPCGVLRSLTLADSRALGANLEAAIARDREKTRADTALAGEAARKLEEFEQARKAALDRVKATLATEERHVRSSDVTARIEDFDAFDRTSQESKRWGEGKTSPFLGHGMPSGPCQTELDSLLADVTLADRERMAASSQVRQTRERIAAQVEADTKEMTGIRQELEALRNRLRVKQAQHLELTMTSSLGFWVTIGLLAIWRLTQPGPHDAH